LKDSIALIGTGEIAASLHWHRKTTAEYTSFDTRISVYYRNITTTTHKSHRK
jgi:hypothetical protein